MQIIGIIVAMEKELKLLLPLLSHKSEIEINNRVFYRGRVADTEVVVAQCGIGKVNAAVTALTMIENFHVRLLINTGVAGGTGNGAGVLDVVVADRVAYHDVWCGPGTVRGQASDCPAFFVTADADRVATHVPGVKTGLIASGDIFVSKPEEVRAIRELYPDAMAVDMESAALAQVCFMKSVPFMVIRVISDTPGEADNISQYNSFWDDAPKSTFEVLKRILNVLQ